MNKYLFRLCRALQVSVSTNLFSHCTVSSSDLTGSYKNVNDGCEMVIYIPICNLECTEIVCH